MAMANLSLQHPEPTILVDGNNFALWHFNGGSSVRTVLDQISQCPVFPIFVFDPLDGNKIRREHFPGYKIRTAEEKKFRESLRPAMDLFRKLIPLSKAIVIRVPGFEADDVIGTLATHQSTPVRIVSTDRDLCQLAVHPHIHPSASMDGIKPNHVRLYKALVGDNSDKIPGIPGFGPKSFQNIFQEDAIKIFETNADFSVMHGFKNSHLDWIDNNRALLQAYWTIVGLFPVPLELISKHTTVGANLPRELDKILMSLYI
jgi:5'-3' exonuclease